MTNPTSPTRAPATFERSYDGPVDDLWGLWATKEGFEAWWGPEGFRVEVHAFDLRVGGELDYDMIAVGAEQIAFMKQAGWALSHGTHGTFAEIVPNRRLTLRHSIDFIPDVAPYDNDMTVELVPAGAQVRMVVTISPHISDEWTQHSAAGFESQLTKIPGVLAARRG